MDWTRIGLGEQHNIQYNSTWQQDNKDTKDRDWAKDGGLVAMTQLI